MKLELHKLEGCRYVICDEDGVIVWEMEDRKNLLTIADLFALINSDPKYKHADPVQIIDYRCMR